VASRSDGRTIRAKVPVQGGRGVWTENTRLGAHLKDYELAGTGSPRVIRDCQNPTTWETKSKGERSVIGSAPRHSK